MTFKLELTDYKIFKDAFESINRIIDEVVLTCDSEGIHLSALDRSHITFVNMELQKTLFDEYQCDIPEKINVDCDEFLKVLKRGNSSDILRLTIDEGNLIVIFYGDSTRIFNIRLIDIEYEPTTPPNINHPIEIKVPSKLLQDSLIDMGLFNDKLKFQIDQDYFKIITDGEMGDANIKYLHGENIQTTAEAMYSIPKLIDIMKASNFSQEAILRFGNDLPLYLSFQLITGDGELSYLLAPRLEQE